MSGGTMAQAGSVALSTLALVLSLVNLYFQRRDRRPRIEIRARYEYRAGPPDQRYAEPDPPPQIHDRSQEGLYLLLGDFLREYGLEYPQGTPVVRFALSNKGERVVYLDAIRLVFRAGGRLSGERLVLDPLENRVLSFGSVQGATANILGARGGGPVELVPGDGVGYRFELIRLSNTLKREGHAGDVGLSFEATDRLGGVHRHPFSVNTDLWAYPAEE